MKKLSFNSSYRVDKHGNVFSFKSKHLLKLKPLIGRDGYLYINTYSKGKNKRVVIHRLVAEAYITKKEGKNCVNHIDGNKQNNCVLNLEWVNHSENHLHAYAIGIRKRRFGNNATNLSINEKIARRIKIYLFVKNFSQTQVSNKLNVNREIVRSIFRGLTWKNVEI